MDGLRRVFDAVCVLATFLALRHDYRPDAIKIAKAASQQLGCDVSIEDLSRIKYLLPDEIVLDYEDIPHDAVGDRSESQKMLVFQFIEKPNKQSETAPEKINKRKERFQRAVAQFMTRRTWEDLVTGAKSVMPRHVSPIKPSPISGESIETIVQSLSEEVVALRTLSPRAGEYGTVPEKFTDLLALLDIKQLYCHQAEAIEHIDQGYSVIVTTSTASGKSLIFQLPIVHAIQNDYSVTAMYLSPTKALAQDQLRAFRNLLGDESVFAFDGDTPKDERPAIIRNGRVILCNPDILHCTMLPNWSRWQRFLENLKFVVLDELHCYQGVFGAHTAMVFRRLRRLCFDLGNESVQFIACSATIERPIDFLAQMTGLDPGSLHNVSHDGSPAGAKHYLLINTPHLVEDDPASGRAHPMTIAAPLLIRLVSSGLRLIAFCRVRRVCELMMRAIREQLNEQADGEELLQCIMSYRGGYAADRRREIEREMFRGNLRGIIATSALEIGIDIGNLDAAVLVGFPFSLASFRQQVGRVGRRSSDSLVILVADGSVLDQTYVNNPDRLFTDKDPAIPLPIEPVIVLSHLECAAHELSLSEEDGAMFPMWDELKDKLEYEDGEYHCAKRNPSETVSLRVADETDIAVVNVTGGRAEILELIEFSRVGFTIYEGAIFHHQGKPYLVVSLNVDDKYANVIETNVQWTTRQRDFTDVNALSSWNTKTVGGMSAAIGKLRIEVTVFGYFKVDRRSKIIDAVDVYLPPFKATRAGMWINLSILTLDTLVNKNLNAAAAIHAAQHLLIGMVPRYVVTATSDLSTECKAPEKELAKRGSTRVRPARLVVYEKYGGEMGNGTARKIYDRLEAILEACYERIESCPCDHGCMDCIAMSSCSEQNVVISKPGARLIFRALTGRDFDGIPDGPEVNFVASDIITVQPVQARAMMGNGVESVPKEEEDDETKSK